MEPKRERVVLPPRELQTATTLATPAIEERRDLLAEEGKMLPTFLPAGNDALPIERQYTLFHEHLYQLSELSEALTTQTIASEDAKKSIGSSGKPKKKNKNKGMPVLLDLEREQRFSEFFAMDALEGEDPYELDDPMAYRSYRELLEKGGISSISERFAETAAAIPHVPRPTDPERVSRNYLLSYRLPPPPGLDPALLCSRGTSCLFYLFHDQHGYVGRALILPSGKFAAPDRYCVDCLLCEWTLQYFENIRMQHVEPECFNSFNVDVCEGEYDSSVILPSLHNGKPTGVAGNVPMYDLNQRALVSMNAEAIATASVALGQPVPSTARYYVAEQYTDFRLASDERMQEVSGF